MRVTVSLLVLCTALAGCSYRGSETWRTGVCDPIVDEAERERCLEDATRTEGEYRRDVDEALERP